MNSMTKPIMSTPRRATPIRSPSKPSITPTTMLTDTVTTKARQAWAQ
jgi:hypothetical protein